MKLQQQKIKKEENELLEKFFRNFSPTHAIPRINEALVLKQLKFNSPILDLGCGDGKFSFLTFGREQIDVGLDLREKEAAKAKRIKAYKKVIVSSASNMPFEDKSFNSIISNSVLEHIYDLDKVLKEAARVLKKNGIFAITLPTPVLSNYFFWSKIIPFWAKFKTKLWKHINYFDEKEWTRKLEKADFKIISIKKTNSRKAIKWADILCPLFPLGPIRKIAPFLLKRKVFGTDSKGATILIFAKKR